MGIELYLNRPYVEEEFKDEYDVVIRCTGNSYKREFVHEFFKECVHTNGQIYLNSELQLTN